MPGRSSPLQSPFGEVVRRKRLEVGISQEELAHRTELHWTYVSGIERGRRNPSLAVVAALAEALGVRPHELVKAAEEAAAK